jgi:Methyltransferase domain
MAPGIETDPYENDPARWGHSLANLAEILVGCLDARGAGSVVEIGAYAGDLTRILLDWAAGPGASMIAIDPTPHERLVQLSRERSDLELIQEESREALGRIDLPDAVIVDGDHNYYTVTEELRLIDERAASANMPLLILHDVGWPHGRRDAYWNPEGIPVEARQPTLERPFIFPGEPGVADTGMPMYAAADHEGGPRNGVLTALEDYLDGRPDLRFARLPPFFGMAVVWPADAPWAQNVAEFLEPWDSHPVMERLEANRVYHLALGHRRSQKLQWTTGALEEQREENAALRKQLEETVNEVERLRARRSEAESS